MIKYIRGSYAATLHITNATIEFFNAQGDRVEVNFAPDLAKGSSEGSRMPLFHEDLQRIGYPAMELEKVEANALLVMTKEGFTSLLEEAWRSCEKEVEFLITNN
ncbi:hypothetical protein F8M41_024101 [Gigaspora margarita]|uniref:Uncharacterized protein n=1 Tax=Gigaspora margarita TaxID=4874 RepID=A0A8H4ACC1_GIGMA|nr:hypothetical protein F8M41_024101 [Gigaspora margarita]